MGDVRQMDGVEGAMLLLGWREEVCESGRAGRNVVGFCAGVG